VPLEDFFARSDVGDGLLAFMAEERISLSFLAIMFAYEKHHRLYRQLALCAPSIDGSSTSDNLMDAVVEYLTEPETSPLDLAEIGGGGTAAKIPPIRSDPRLLLRFFDQRNVQPSRKQIGPLLVSFFEQWGTR